jgi:hypothetical protein
MSKPEKKEPGEIVKEVETAAAKRRGGPRARHWKVPHTDAASAVRAHAQALGVQEKLFERRFAEKLGGHASAALAELVTEHQAEVAKRLAALGGEPTPAQ